MTSVSDDPCGDNSSQEKRGKFPDAINNLLKRHSKCFTVEDFYWAIVELECSQPRLYNLESELGSMKTVQAFLSKYSKNILAAIHETNRLGAETCRELAQKVPYYQDVPGYDDLFTDTQKLKIEHFGMLMLEGQDEALETIPWEEAPQFLEKMHSRLNQFEADALAHNEWGCSISELIDVVFAYTRALEEKFSRKVLVDRVMRAKTEADKCKMVCNEKMTLRPRIGIPSTEAKTEADKCKMVCNEKMTLRTRIGIPSTEAKREVDKCKMVCNEKMTLRTRIPIPSTKPGVCNEKKRPREEKKTDGAREGKKTNKRARQVGSKKI